MNTTSATSWSGPKPNRNGPMAFQAKSNLAMGAILTTVYGVYFAVIMGRASAEPVADMSWRPLMMLTFVTIIILTIVTHAVIAIVATRQASTSEERVRANEFRGDGIGGIVLAVGVFGGLALAVLDTDVFPAHRAGDSSFWPDVIDLSSVPGLVAELDGVTIDNTTHEKDDCIMLPISVVFRYVYVGRI